MYLKCCSFQYSHHSFLTIPWTCMCRGASCLNRFQAYGSQWLLRGCSSFLPPVQQLLGPSRLKSRCVKKAGPWRSALGYSRDFAHVSTLHCVVKSITASRRQQPCWNEDIIWMNNRGPCSGIPESQKEVDFILKFVPGQLSVHSQYFVKIPLNIYACAYR